MRKLFSVLWIRAGGALLTLFRHPRLAVRILTESRLLLTKKEGYHGFTAIADALNYGAKLDELVRDLHVDVIQAHYARQDTLICEIVAARHRVPVVIVTYAEAVCWPEEGEVISTEALYGTLVDWDPLFRRTYETAVHVCSPSFHCAQGPRRFISPEKITVIYSSINTAALRQQAERRQAYAHELGVLGQKVILYVGQITPRKGPQFLAMAAQKILEAEPSARIVFIGSDIGGYTSELKALAAVAGSRVLFPGAVSSESLWKYFAVADALAFPTFTDRECMGMSMKEALATGTPVVAFRAGGTPEAIEDGVTGYLVPVGDVEALAHRLLCVLRGDLGPNARTQCRDRALKLFDIEVGAEAEYQVLKRAVAEKATAL